MDMRAKEQLKQLQNDELMNYLGRSVSVVSLFDNRDNVFKYLGEVDVH